MTHTRDLDNSSLGNVVMIFVEPASLNAEIFSHLVQIVDTIRKAHKVPSLVANVSNHALDLRQAATKGSSSEGSSNSSKSTE